MIGCTSIFGQSGNFNFYYCTYDNQQTKIDSFIYIGDGNTEIKVLIRDKEHSITPKDIKYLNCVSDNYNLTIESVLDFKTIQYDYTKTGVFLSKIVSGKINLYLFKGVHNGEPNPVFCVKDKNKWLCFDVYDKRFKLKAKDYFKNKDSVLSYFNELYNSNRFTLNCIKELIELYNESP